MTFSIKIIFWYIFIQFFNQEFFFYSGDIISFIIFHLNNVYTILKKNVTPNLNTTENLRKNISWKN